MRGIRTRLAIALVALVAVTVTAIGLGTYVFVEARLRDGLLGEASRQAQFNLSVLVPERLPAGVTREAYAASGLNEAFRLRGGVETIVDYRDGGQPESSSPLRMPPDVIDSMPQELRDSVAAGRLAYSWQTVAGEPSLVVAGRSPGGGPDFYFVFPSSSVVSAIEQLRIGLVVAGLLAVLLALAMAGLVARGILRPVSSGSAAAARIAAGDLSARVPVGGADEFARFGAEFNRMADSLASTVARLETSQNQNRRFVADVSHELRTPLTALVAEASLIESSLPSLPPDARRAAELLVADVRRLRVLVDDLMEISRFDARAEQAELERVDLRSAIRSIVASRLPRADLRLPSEPVWIEGDVRRLDRIVGNLLDNARLHAPDAPVEVSVSQDRGHAEVRVADRGPGVDPAALRHLFDRFFKADASRGSGGSSGLGLAIAAEHAALLGGELRAANRAAGGLEVVLRLPVTRSLPASDREDIDEGEPLGASGVAPTPTPPARPPT
jgi:two-component system, OmpR family, sensor histidine kinase MtrB